MIEGGEASAGDRPGRLRAAVLQWSEGFPALDSAALIAHVHAVGLAAEAAQVLAPGRCGGARDFSLEAARRVWRGIFDKLVIESRQEQDLAAAVRCFQETSSPELRRQAIARTEACAAVRRRGADEVAEGWVSRGWTE